MARSWPLAVALCAALAMSSVTAQAQAVSSTPSAGQQGPPGATGGTGPAGSAATVAVGTVSGLPAGSAPTVVNVGTGIAAVLNFGIPAGATGSTGGTGPAGSAATIAAGTVTTLSPSAPATVTNAGTSSAAIFNFGIPQGATGATGATGGTGAAATIAVGTTTTLAPAAPATVTNVGTSGAAIFNFGIPQGTTGATGPTGPAGANAFGSPTSRTLSLATAFQATTTTKPAVVSINLSSSASLTITGGTTNSATVYIGATNSVASGGGTAVCEYRNGNTGTLTLGLALSQTYAGSCVISLPTGWFFAVIQNAGTVSILSAADQSVG